MIQFKSERFFRLQTVVLTLFSFFGGVAYFLGDPLKADPLGLILIFSLSLNFWLIFEIIIKKGITLLSKTSLTDALLYELKGMNSKKDYYGILRRRKDFSRSLWVEGKVQERIELGKLAESAAVHIGDKEAQVAALIDDLGWTSVQTGDYKNAKRYLDHGLSIAEKESMKFWIAKSLRHLAGLSFKQDHLNDAQNYLERALEFSKKIKDEKLQYELLGGIYYGLSLLFSKQKEYALALDFANKSEEQRKANADQTREVRIYSLKGNILEKMDKKELALDSYRVGLELAQKINRIDEIAKNALGLSRVYNTLHDEYESERYKNLANEIMKKYPLPFGEE